MVYVLFRLLAKTYVEIECSIDIKRNFVIDELQPMYLLRATEIFLCKVDNQMKSDRIRGKAINL